MYVLSLVVYHIFLGTILSTFPLSSLTFQPKWPVWKKLLVYFWSDWFEMRLCAFPERRPRDKWVKCQFSQNNNSSKFMKEHLNFKGHDLSSILNEKKQVIWQVVSSRLPPENITRMHRLITYKQTQTSVHYPYCLLLFGKVYMRENTFMSISDCHTLFSIWL